MKKNLLLGIAAGGLLAGSSGAQQMPNPAPMPPNPLMPKISAPLDDEAATKGDKGSGASLGAEISGRLTVVDKDKLSLSTPGSGQQELKVAPHASITRDGKSASLDQLKPGDQIRVSFDPQSKEATSLEVHSKARQ